MPEAPTQADYLRQMGMTLPERSTGKAQVLGVFKIEHLLAIKYDDGRKINTQMGFMAGDEVVLLPIDVGKEKYKPDHATTSKASGFINEAIKKWKKRFDAAIGKVDVDLAPEAPMMGGEDKDGDEASK